MNTKKSINPVKHTFLGLLILTICAMPLGLLMFVGRPHRLIGILYDIEKFIGIHTFVMVAFFSPFILIGLEALWSIIKKNSKYIYNIILLLFFGGLYFYITQNNIFYKKEKEKEKEKEKPFLI